MDNYSPPSPPERVSIASIFIVEKDKHGRK
jgi:hypothetical protein